MARQPLAINGITTSPKQNYVRPRVKQDRPAYGVVAPGFFDDKDKFWNPGEALYFDGEPSLSMVPLNKMAYERIQIMLDALDMYGEQKAKQDKKAFKPQPRQLWTEDDLNEDFPMPSAVMGAKKEGENQAIR